MMQNMNRRNFLNAGNIVIGKVITADQLGLPDSEQELTRILRTFNCKNALVTLSRINLLFHRSTNLLEDERILKKAYCSPVILNAIDASTELRGNFVFNRQATLRLLDECAYVSDSESTPAIDGIGVTNDLARAYLIVNGLLNSYSSDPSLPEDERWEKNLLVEAIPSISEYALNTAPEYETKKLIVRTEKIFRHFQEKSSGFDVNEIFSRATGLTLQDYHRLVYGIFAVYWTFTAEEIHRQDPLLDKSLFFDPKGQSPDLTPLYEKLLSHICVSIDKLKDKTEKQSQFKDEFRLWRRSPLLKISENQIICVDFSFLLDKLRAGAFWIIRDHLKDRKKKGIFDRLWGEAFEDYATSIIKRGINNQNLFRRDRLIIRPKYDHKQQAECSDAIVCCDDTLILLECKSSTLSAHAKFSGNFETFSNNIKPVKRGIEQLWNAIQQLGNQCQSRRRIVKEIDICKVKKIYPVLVLSDRVCSALLMNRFLDSEFESLKQKESLMKHLKVMPLTVLTIADLESLEPYMSDKPFYTHLDKWLEQFRNQDAQGFSSYLYDMVKSDPRQHSFMDQEFAGITSDILNYFSSRGIK